MHKHIKHIYIKLYKHDQPTLWQGTLDTSARFASASAATSAASVTHQRSQLAGAHSNNQSSMIIYII
jgi:hypothetical protein